MSECECGHDELDHDHRDVCELCDCDEYVALDDDEVSPRTAALEDEDEGDDDDDN